MTREERCKLAIKKGYTYDEDTGNIFNRFGRKIKTSDIYGYIIIQIHYNKKRFSLKAHQFVYYYKYGRIVDCIDHINGMRDDNRINNLREVTHQQNQYNQKNPKGCYLDKKTNKFQSKINFDGNEIYLGYFNTEQEARQAYLDAKKIYHII